MGAIHPEIAKKVGLSQTAYVFELDFKSVREKALPVFSEISRFPEVRRDIAVIVDQDVSAQSLETVIRAKAGEYFTKFTIFDIYQGKGIELHRKSVAIGLTFQSKSSTLTDETINPIVESVVQSLEEELSAVLRS
jgi:phenylalanyl-tRNA synthetase beta chain